MEIVIVFGFVLVILILALMAFFLKKGEPVQDTSKIRAEIQHLDTQIASKDPVQMKSAVIGADKVLDHVLKMKRIKGETMGERLKNCSNLFPKNTYELIWRSHKTRNKLAHEIGYNPPTQHLQNDYKVLRNAALQLIS